MVIEPVKKLDGKGLLDERDRLANLAAFPDQELVAPVMGAVKNRAAQIAAYTRTPEGQRKVTNEKSRRYWVKAEQETRERRQADAAFRQVVLGLLTLSGAALLMASVPELLRRA